MISGTYQFKPPLPFIPGKLPVGVVTAAGSGVTRFKPGDHALLLAESAGFAEFTVMPENQCIKLPQALPFEEAAAMALVYDTAYFAQGKNPANVACPAWALIFWFVVVIAMVWPPTLSLIGTVTVRGAEACPLRFVFVFINQQLPSGGTFANCIVTAEQAELVSAPSKDL